ncbi:MAG TPA: YibE/F family protein [Spirochaetota bacterium]|nr:YibE/F family protein [Spirochaetota bacterium]
MKKSKLILCILSGAAALLFMHTNAFCGLSSNVYHDQREYSRAKITKIEKHTFENTPGTNLIETRVHLHVLDGELAGQHKTAVFKGEDDMPKEMFYQEGDTVFIGISQDANREIQEYISLYDIDNTPGIIVMGLLLVLVVVAIGRVRGFFALVSLVVTILLLFFILIPFTLKGYPPLPIAVLISIISVIITLPIIAGFRLKTLAAVLGASAGIVLSSVLAVIFGWTMHLSGLITNEMLTVFYASDVAIDLRGLALSGMIIAALGAVMDVCISIASSTAEIYSAKPDISPKDAFKSVLTIGTDIMGSMVNTLILAYVGSSLSLILLISMRFSADMPVWMIFNYNPVLSEIVKSVVGSVGMFACIPITALIAVYFYRKKAAGEEKTEV